MILKDARVNGLVLRQQRATIEYEAVMVDLYLAGIITKEVCEGLTGRRVNVGLSLLPEQVEHMQSGPVEDSSSAA